MAEEVRITQRPVHGWPFTPPTGTITSASSCFTTWASKTEALDIRRCSQLWGVPGVAAPTHLRMRAMVSFLSFPWNGSDPVSISNCKGTQDGECSDGQDTATHSPRKAMQPPHLPVSGVQALPPAR